jgi:hypothetical protein
MRNDLRNLPLFERKVPLGQKMVLLISPHGSTSTGTSGRIEIVPTWTSP